MQILNALLDRKPKSVDEIRNLKPKLPLDLLKYSREILSVFAEGGISSFELEQKKMNDLAQKNESFMNIIRDIQSEFSLNLSNSFPQDSHLKKSSSEFLHRPVDKPFEFDPPAAPLKEIPEEKYKSVQRDARDSRGWDTYTQADPQEALVSDDDEEVCSDSSSDSHRAGDG